MRLIDPKTKEVFSVFPYLEISKKIKLYEKMMEIMVNKTFKLFSKEDIEFSINLSYEDIANESFMDFLYEKIKSYHKPQNIIFEIYKLQLLFIYEHNFLKSLNIFIFFYKLLQNYNNLSYYFLEFLQKKQEYH